MKYRIMMGILFTLLMKKKVSAKYLSDKFEVSERSIYRYVDELSIAGIPVYSERGRNGGIYIPDTYRLPNNFMTESEYSAAINALEGINGELKDSNLAAATDKLKMQVKSERKYLSVNGNFIIDSGTWGDTNSFPEKLKVIQKAAEENTSVEMQYRSRTGENSTRIIDPHVLVLKQNIWYVYAYCHTRESFRLFKIGRIRSMTITDKKFERRQFDRDDIPLKFWHDEKTLVNAVFKISSDALPYAEEWLGADNIQKRKDFYFCEAELPYDDVLVSKILSIGHGFEVIEPKTLRDKVTEEIKKLLNSYE